MPGAPKQKPGRWAGLGILRQEEAPPSGRLVLKRRLFAFRGFAAARALGERGFDLLDGLGLGDALDSRDFSGQPVEGSLVKLALAIGLLGLRVGAEQIAYDLGNRHDVS